MSLVLFYGVDVVLLLCKSLLEVCTSVLLVAVENVCLVIRNPRATGNEVKNVPEVKQQ